MYQQLLQLTLANIPVLILSMNSHFDSLPQVLTAIEENVAYSRTRKEGIVFCEHVQCENLLQGNTHFWRSEPVTLFHVSHTTFAKYNPLSK